MASNCTSGGGCEVIFVFVFTKVEVEEEEAEEGEKLLVFKTPNPQIPCASDN